MNEETHKKHTRYQDYVIRDGKLVGEFEELYRDFEQPWEQIERERWMPEKAMALNFIARQKAARRVSRVLEIGCGLGEFSKRISDLGCDVCGVDVSATAISKARLRHPALRFEVGDLLCRPLIEEFRPDAVVLAEISWYVLDKLKPFVELLKALDAGCFLLHMLTVYPPNQQKYGNSYFTNLREIKNFFNLNFLEWGEVSTEDLSGCSRTYFAARIEHA